MPFPPTFIRTISLASALRHRGYEHPERVHVLVPAHEHPQLPIEIWEYIFDILSDGFGQYEAWERRSTFAACCLTCPFWVPRSRYHLFKRVEIRSRGQVIQVSNLLKSIPELCTRVEELSLVGRNDGKGDLSWMGHAAYYLGPRLKGVKVIQIVNADLSYASSRFYLLWGAFNTAWLPGAKRRLELSEVTVAHFSHAARLALVVKAENLWVGGQNLQLDTANEHHARPAPPILALLPGLSLLLRALYIRLDSPDLFRPIPWDTLARRCPSLSEVQIRLDGVDSTFDFSRPTDRSFLATIYRMFRQMLQPNTSTLLLITWLQDDTRLVLEAKPHDLLPNSLHRKMDFMGHGFLNGVDRMEQLSQILVCFEGAMLGTNNTDTKFHQINIVSPFGYHLSPSRCQCLDDVLSRRHVATPDVQVLFEEWDNSHEEGCVLSWSAEYFPKTTQHVPTAFCNPEAGRPCRYHPRM